jgi:hypothetical protein
VILFPMVTTGTWFNLKEGLQNRGGGDDGSSDGGGTRVAARARF